MFDIDDKELVDVEKVVDRVVKLVRMDMETLRAELGTERSSYARKRELSGLDKASLIEAILWEDFFDED
jgi:hypothetical protein